jgi:hypothetical protein
MSKLEVDSSQTLLSRLTLNPTFRLPETRVVLTWLAVAVGLFLRIVEFTDNRQLYLDERLLLENLTDLPVWDLHTVLRNDQLAPPGFLVLERVMVRLPLPIIPTARLIPFLAAIATMFYFPRVAKRYLDPRAVPLATALFALGDYSIYYASEIKQYSVETALALMALGLAAWVDEDCEPADRQRRLLILSAFGVIGVWFSLPLIFSLAGVGLAFFLSRLKCRDWSQVATWTGIGSVWLLSFGGCFLVCDRIVTKAPFLRTWWDFAFLRIPPKSTEEAIGVLWQLVNVIIDPVGVVGPVSHVWTAILGSGLAILGFVVIANRSIPKSVIIVAPFVLAVIAAALKHYPFHGRLIQFLTPSILFFLAEGVASISRLGKTGRVVALLLAAFLLYQPSVDALYYRVMVRRSRPFDSHGDLHNDLLDELENRARKSLRQPVPRR